MPGLQGGDMRLAPENRPLRWGLIATLILGLGGALAGGSVPPAAAEDGDATRPSLADLMSLTQLRHFKLWYAQRVGNWPLANYEMRQFEQTVRRVVQLYPAVGTLAEANLIREKTDPAMADLRKALADKDSAAFENAFVRLTGACNDCHRAANVGFIVVQTPKRSPFSNQQFETEP